MLFNTKKIVTKIGVRKEGMRNDMYGFYIEIICKITIHSFIYIQLIIFIATSFIYHENVSS